MHISRIKRAGELVDARAKLIDHLDLIGRNGVIISNLEIKYEGGKKLTAFDDKMLDVVLRAVAVEIKARLLSTEASLKELGVDLGKV